MDYKKFLPIILICFVQISIAQNNSIYQNHSFKPFDRYIYQSHNRFHTSIQPYNNNEIEKIVNIDTLYSINVANPIANTILNNDIIEYNSPDFNFTVNPAFNFETSKQLHDSIKGWTNCRGILINADINKKVFLSTSFYEIQSEYTDYRNDRILELGRSTVPGIGLGKTYGDDGKALDYAFSQSYISYVPSNIFNFELGHGKHFIGDGYRSLLLSDNTSNYPYFKISTNIWKLKYVNMWSQHSYVDNPHEPNSRYPKKWNVMHYLDWSVTKWLNIGIFETIIWQNEDSLGNYRGFEFNYLNPVIFLRPVEFSIGSPDNVMMGLNGKLTLWKNHVFYGQFVIDEFKFSEMKAQNGWWGNKFGIQAGYKTFDIAHIKNLDFQSEINVVRPFTYSHFTYSQQYGHALQPLAHPRGANFYESVNFLRYSYKRWFAQAKFQYLVYGSDTLNSNFGNNIFKLYTTRSLEYGNTIAESAIKNTVIYKDFTLSYMINPKSNMNITFGVTDRNHEIQENTPIKKQLLYYFAFRTTLNNFYYDF